MEPAGTDQHPSSKTKKVLTTSTTILILHQLFHHTTPRTILQLGSFGGGYFRDIISKVNKVNYTNVWHELPQEWLKGINIETHVASPIYNKKINRYQQNCGAKNGKADHSV